MNLTNEQIQAILDGVPEGATHVDIEGDYWVMQDTRAQFWMDELEWCYAEPQEPLHNLSDLREIITLRQEVERLQANLYSKTDIANQLKYELTKAFDRQSEVAATVDRLREALDDLQGNSAGVAGLHMNGDIATWDSLRQGGHFESWLMAFDETPRQNLNAIKREAFIEGFIKGYESDVSVDPKELAIDSVDLCYPDKE